MNYVRVIGFLNWCNGISLGGTVNLTSDSCTKNIRMENLFKRGGKKG